MTKTYHEFASTLSTTPQTSPIPGRTDQVKNSAGGYVFALDSFGILDRFLILGTEAPTYYASAKELTANAASKVATLLSSKDGVRAVARIVEISDAGRAPKNDPALLALALACSVGTPETKAAAYAALPKVARTGTHLLQFSSYINSMRGWGRGLRRAVGAWYTERSPMALASQLTKYQSRNGWSQADVIRLAHPRASGDKSALLGRALGKETDISNAQVKGYVDAVSRVAQLTDRTHVAEAIKLISEHDLPREVVRSELYEYPEIWEAMLPHMGPTAMLRNLATMTRVGILGPQSDALKLIANKLTDADALKAARVHPLEVLKALYTYKNGRGIRGKHVWTPVPKVVDALDAAFYEAFGTLTPSGNRILLAIDVSGSMAWNGNYGAGWDVCGVPGLTPRVVSAAMAMVTARTEAEYEVMGFGHQFTSLAITPRMRLDDVIRCMERLPMQRTDCSLPMRWAKEQKLKFDGFVVYTDNETYAGPEHPVQALRNYRAASGIDARSAVVALTATSFTIADPTDRGMLDVVGFDSAAPQLIADFVAGRV